MCVTREYVYVIIANVYVMREHVWVTADKVYVIEEKVYLSYVIRDDVCVTRI